MGKYWSYPGLHPKADNRSYFMHLMKITYIFP